MKNQDSDQIPQRNYTIKKKLPSQDVIYKALVQWAAEEESKITKELESQIKKLDSETNSTVLAFPELKKKAKLIDEGNEESKNAEFQKLQQDLNKDIIKFNNNTENIINFYRTHKVEISNYPNSLEFLSLEENRGKKILNFARDRFNEIEGKFKLNKEVVQKIHNSIESEKELKKGKIAKLTHLLNMTENEFKRNVFPRVERIDKEQNEEKYNIHLHLFQHVINKAIINFNNYVEKIIGSGLVEIIRSDQIHKVEISNYSDSPENISSYMHDKLKEIVQKSKLNRELVEKTYSNSIISQESLAKLDGEQSFVDVHNNNPTKDTYYVLNGLVYKYDSDRYNKNPLHYEGKELDDGVQKMLNNMFGLQRDYDSKKELKNEAEKEAKNNKKVSIDKNKDFVYKELITEKLINKELSTEFKKLSKDLDDIKQNLQNQQNKIASNEKIQNPRSKSYSNSRVT